MCSWNDSGQFPPAEFISLALVHPPPPFLSIVAYRADVCDTNEQGTPRWVAIAFEQLT